MKLAEMRKGYEEEVSYQKQMIKNLVYRFQLCTIVSGFGVVLFYLFYSKNLGLNILGIIMFVIGALGMLLFGYTGWKGQQNVKALIDDYEQKINYIQQKNCKHNKKRLL